MSAEISHIRALLESDPAAGILAAIPVVEAMLYDFDHPTDSESAEAQYSADVWELRRRIVAMLPVAVAAAGRWRGVVERHENSVERPGSCYWCNGAPWPCPDLRETADEARAYLGVSA